MKNLFYMIITVFHICCFVYFLCICPAASASETHPALSHAIFPDTPILFYTAAAITFLLLISSFFNFKFYNISRNNNLAVNDNELNIFKNKVNDYEGRITDLDERTFTEAKLKENAENFRKVIEHSPAAIAVIDVNTNTALSVNASFIKLFGYRQPELKTIRDWFNTAYPDETYRQKVMQVWNNKIDAYNADGIFTPIEANVRCQDGSSKIIEFNYAAFGNLQLVTCIDLTERKKNEEAIALREQKLKKQNEAIMGLILNGGLFNNDFNGVTKKITEFCSRILEVERVSIWLYLNDYSIIKCIDLFEFSKSSHTSGITLNSSEFANYAACHKQGQVIAAADVYTDLRTHNITLEYLKQNKISSLLDAPIWLNNQVGGILSCEHTGQKRTWTFEEERIMITMTTLLSLCFENSERQKNEKLNLENNRLLQKQNEKILNLMLSGTLFHGNFKKAANEITEISADLLNAERVSIWEYNETNSILKCINLFEYSKKVHSAGAELYTKDFPNYIAKLKSGKIISAFDVYNDPAVNEIPKFYYQKYNICSLLDAPFWINKKIGGVICFENVSEKRQWTPAEERTVALIVTLISLCFEISERQKTENELKEKEKILNTLINATPDIICFKDGEGRWLIANSASVNLLNLQAIDYKYKKSSELAKYTPQIYEEMFLMHEKTDNEAWLKKSSIRNNAIVPLAGGGCNVYEIIKTPIFNQDESRLGLVILGRDITERKKTEEKLRISEEKFRAIFENTAEGIALYEVIYDSQGSAVDYKVINVNTAYEKQMNVSAENVIGLNASFIYRMAIPPDLNEFEKVASTGIPYFFSTYFEPREKYFNVSVISYKKGHFAKIFEDVTEIKRNTEELKKKNEEMTRFIYTVSHDLKSPLVTIRAFTDFLKQDIEKKDESGISRDIHYIHTAADKMGLLLDELLELSRIDRKINPKKEIPLANIVNLTLEQMAEKLSKKNIEVITDIENVIVYGDTQRIFKIYHNLIDNSIKFMRDQPYPKIEIGIKNENDQLILFVKDNGPGVDPRYHHKLFGLFEKLDPVSEGVGMGLALAKKIVEIHDGKIWVESEGCGKGMICYFTLAKTRLNKES